MRKKRDTMGKAILFDLDGTLLPMDTEAFVHHYMQAIVPHVKDFLPPDKFLKVLWEATNTMIENVDPNLTNEEVFTDYFVEKSGINRSDIWPTFDKFYEEHFPLLKKHTSPTTLSKEIVKIAKEQGYHVVIATNPVFPKAAIHERLNWLELIDFPFDMVTVYEESHYCKPQPNYFKEILDTLGVKPEDGIMIGNDIQEDMVASKLGMKTYLVTDYIIDRGSPNYQIDQKGTLEELHQQLKNKEGIFQ